MGTNNPKPCPFCGHTPWLFRTDMVQCANKDCFMHYDDDIDLADWNTRPIEDALLARAEKAETMVKRLIGEIDKHISGDELTPVEAWYYGKLPALVTEWKESK